MPLAETLPLESQIDENPPLKLKLGGITIPSHVELTFVGVGHNIHFNSPDYLADMLRASDICAWESIGWTSNFARDMQRTAKGDAKARQRLINVTTEPGKSSNMHTSGSALYERECYSALFRSKVRIILPDYPSYDPNSSRDVAERSIIYFAANLDNEKSLVRDKAMEAMARRDSYILQRLCEAIAAYKHETRPSTDTTRVCMPYGMMHLAVVDAFAYVAKTQQAEGVTTHKLYEVWKTLPEDHALSGCVEAATKGLTAYQNWLRGTEHA